MNRVGVVAELDRVIAELTALRDSLKALDGPAAGRVVWTLGPSGELVRGDG